MRAFLFPLLFCSLSLLSFSQKNVDLKLRVFFSTEQDTLYDLGVVIPVKYKMQIINVGNTTISASDNLLIYETIDADTVFHNINLSDTTNYLAGYNQEILVGDTITIYPIGYDEVMEEGDFNQCFIVHSQNSGNPITDIDLSNNTTCAIRYYSTGSTGINAEENVDLKIWPNPASNKIHFNFDVQHVHLYSLDGKEVVDLSYNNNEIDVSKVPSGVYVLNFSYDHQPYFKKMVIE